MYVHNLAYTYNKVYIPLKLLMMNEIYSIHRKCLFPHVQLNFYKIHLTDWDPAMQVVLIFEK